MNSFKEIIYKLLHPNTINIHSKWSYPSCALSNFACYDFEVDGVTCKSMEGFLQSLKFENIREQQELCLLVGKFAKERGSKKDWKTSQTLYWQGKPYKRQSQEYSELLKRAYLALSENNDFKKALIATKNKKLRHAIGGKNPTETILTEREFCELLANSRNKNTIFMKEFDYNQEIKICGVTFNGVEDIINCAVKKIAKNGVFVGEDSERYPCFDSYDYASDNSSYWNFVFAKSKEELDAKLAKLKAMSPLGFNYKKLTMELSPMAYWRGDPYYKVEVAE